MSGFFENGFWSDYFENGFWSDFFQTTIPPLEIEFDEIKYSALVEIDFSTGTRYYSFGGVSSPSAWYKDAVLSIGSINRETPYLGGDYRVADTEIELANVDLEFSILKAGVGFRNRTVRIRFGNLFLGLSNLQTIYTGKITGWTISSGRIRLEIRDDSYDRFRVNLAGRLNRNSFPNLPIEQELKLYPIIYGEVTSTTGLGALPAYLVDVKTS